MNEIERAKPSVLAQVSQELLYRHEWLIWFLTSLAFIRLLPSEFALFLIAFWSLSVPIRFGAKPLSPTNPLFDLLRGIPGQPFKNTRVMFFEILLNSRVYVRKNVAVITKSTLDRLTPEEAAWLIETEAESAKHTLPTKHLIYLIGMAVPGYYLYLSITSDTPLDAWKWVPIFLITFSLFVYARITARRFVARRFASILHYEKAHSVLRKLARPEPGQASRIFTRHSDSFIVQCLNDEKYKKFWLTRTLF